MASIKQENQNFQLFTGIWMIQAKESRNGTP